MRYQLGQITILHMITIINKKNDDEHLIMIRSSIKQHNLFQKLVIYFLLLALLLSSLFHLYIYYHYMQ